VDGDAERGDRLACSSQPLPIGGGRDEHLGEIDDTDQPGVVPFLPAGEESAGLRMVRIGAVEGADENVGVENDAQRCSSSSSSLSRYPGG
jgi:hypothetical protein